MRRFRTAQPLLAIIALLTLITCFELMTPRAAMACDTPVYRYAMYQWLPSDYRLFFVYSGELSETDRAAIEHLRQTLDDPERPANASLHLVNLADTSDEALARLPRAVREWHARHQNSATTGLLVLTPHGRLLDETPIAADAVGTLLASPARQRLATLLHDGHSGVLLLLRPAISSTEDRAAQVVEEVVRRAAQGEIQPALLPGVAIEDFGESAQQSPLDVGVLVVDRDDPRERWFVRQLLSIEDDLPQYTDPMVFPVYGRGRAMEPYVGEGITAENLADAVAFMSGACSCEVKELNPGMDLLMSWDWESTAERLARRVGDEVGNESYVTAENMLSAVVGGTDSVGDADGLKLDLDESSKPVALTPQVVPDPLSEEEPTSEALSKAGEDVNRAIAFDFEGQFNNRLVRNLVVGVGLGFVVLVGATFVIVRIHNGGG